MYIVMDPATGNGWLVSLTEKVKHPVTAVFQYFPIYKRECFIVYPGIHF